MDEFEKEIPNIFSLEEKRLSKEEDILMDKLACLCPLTYSPRSFLFTNTRSEHPIDSSCLEHLHVLLTGLECSLRKFQESGTLSSEKRISLLNTVLEKVKDLFSKISFDHEDVEELRREICLQLLNK